MQINSNKNVKITDRILKVLEIKGITKYKFHKDLGLSNGFLDKSREIGTDKYANILEYFSDINSEWLLTGKGEMLKGKRAYKNIESTEEPVSAYGLKKGIPLVSIEDIGGFGSSDFSIRDQDIQDRYIVPDFTNIDFMIRVKGSSMYPKYNSGDIVACRIINNSEFIQWNKVHVIATNEQGMLIKRIKEGRDNDVLKIVSDNKDYDSFFLPKNEITGMALVIGVIRLE